MITSDRVRQPWIGFNELTQQYLHPMDIVESLREGLLVLDAELSVLFANSAFYRMFKADRRETQGRLIYELGNGQWNIPALRRLLEEILPRDNNFEGYLVEHDFPDIGLRVMMLNARLVRRSDKKMILLSLEDVTDRHRAEVERGRIERKYVSLVEDINSVIIGLDEYARITFFNSFAEKIFQYSREEVIGKPLVPAIIPEQESDGTDNIDFAAKIAADPKKYYAKRSEGIRKDGERVYFSWSLKCQEDETENFKYLIDGNDITEQEILRREAEAASKQLIGLGTVVSTVSHELRNPLAMIKAQVHALKKAVGEDAYGERFASLEVRISEANSLIDNLLHQAKAKEPQFRAWPLCQITDAAVETIGKKLSRKNVHIGLTCSCDRAQQVEIDSFQMNQVIANILDNAVDAVAPETGRVDIEIACHVDKGEAVITVTDNGTGISEADLKSVFEPFFTRKAKGTGLGLAVSISIVERHRGRIEAESIPGEGSTFRIVLPLKH